MFSTGNEYADSIFSNVSKKFIEDTLARNNLIRVGPSPSGNLSERDLKEGAKGALPPAPSANNTGVLNSLGVNFSGSKMPLYIIGGALVLGLIYFAVKK